MDWSLVAFAAFATIAIVGALMVILKSNPVASAFSLVLVFFSFSGLYALMGAHLVAALQILVYTGAIMVLFVFVIMLLNQDQDVDDLRETGIVYKGVAGLGCAGLVFILIHTVLRAKDLVPTGTLTDDEIAKQGGNLRVISEALYTDHIFHFELTSFLLLGAVVSTIALAKRKTRRGEAI
jgi:NADH-quinone oxidoreductase subunit J